MGLFKRKEPPAEPVEYDRDNWTPALRRSICTGEREAGLFNRRTRQFRSECLIRDQRDLDAFQKRYGVTQLPEIH